MIRRDREYVESVVDDLLAAHSRKIDAQYAASSCGTRSDFDKLHKAEKAYNAAYEEAVCALAGVPVESGLPPHIAKLTPSDWRHIHETANVLLEQDYDDELPEEEIMTSIGYVCVAVVGPHEDDVQIRCFGEDLFREDWIEPPGTVGGDFDE